VHAGKFMSPSTSSRRPRRHARGHHTR
jgi:hypothetical protein